MRLERAVGQSRFLSLARGAHGRLASWFDPVTRRLAAADRALLRVVRGSRIHGWLTTDHDPDSVVIDLREAYPTRYLLVALERFAAIAAGSRAAEAANRVADRIASAPARAAGIALSLAFTASLLVTAATSQLTRPIYAFHALGLFVGLVALRERRNLEALAEAPVWGPFLAVFVSLPEPDEDR
jgi:hypothetical protein